MLQAHEIALIVTAIVVVILLLRKHKSEPLFTGYPRLKCPSGYIYDLDGGECMPSVTPTLVGSFGKTIVY